MNNEKKENIFVRGLAWCKNHKLDITLTLLAIAGTGVAVYEARKADSLKKENDRQREENERLQRENREAQEENQKLQGQNAQLKKENKALGRENANLNYHLGKQVEKNSKPRPRKYGYLRDREVNNEKQ